MTLQQLIIGWFYYGVIYMGLSILATVMINRVTKRWYTAPLIINAIAIIVLMLGVNTGLVVESEHAFALYFIYMPIVFSSFAFNLLSLFWKKLKAHIDIKTL